MSQDQNENKVPVVSGCDGGKISDDFFSDRATQSVQGERPSRLSDHMSLEDLRSLYKNNNF